MLRLYPIGTGYRVSDADAGRLVKALRVPLPRAGYEVQIVLPDGGIAWLSRTPLRTSAYGFKAPKRGWVWYVHASRDLSRYVKSSKAPRRAAKNGWFASRSDAATRAQVRRKVTGSKALGRSMRKYARGEDAVYAVSQHFRVGNRATELSARAALEDLVARKAPKSIVSELAAAIDGAR